MELFRKKILELFQNEKNNYILWLPVVFIFGIILRFRLEESLKILNIFLMIALILLILVSVRTRKIITRMTAITVIFVIVGYIRTDFIIEKYNFPIIKKPTGRVKITGTVEKEIININKNKRTTKDIIVLVEKIESFDKKFEKSETPKKLQIRLINADEKVYLGNIILTAQVFPIENKTLPSSFDKRRYLYFKGIGGLGYKGKVIQNDKINGRMSIEQKINSLRLKIAKRIIEIRPESKSSGIVAILLTGQKNLADKEAIENMNLSGLSHLLSISGLHMMILIYFTTLITKWILLRFEAVANKYNVFKLSALVSLIINFFYLLLSGANVSAVRAYLMSIILLFSIVLGRFNTGLRSVMFTMLFMVFLEPYVIYMPGFQLSFLAVIILVAVIEYYYKIKYYEANLFDIGNYYSMNNISIFNKVTEYFKLSFILSLAVECATTPFSVYNFNNYSFYNILVNSFLTPVVTFFVLPLSIISLILMPIKLDFLAVLPATYGMDIVLWFSNFIVNLPKSVMFIRSPNSFSLFFMIFGILWFCLWCSKLRKFGILLYGIGLIILFFQKTPDIIIENKNKTIFFFDEDFYVLNPDKYKTKEIIKKFGKVKYFDLSTVELDTCHKTIENKNGKIAKNNKKLKCSRLFKINDCYFFFKNGNFVKILENDGKYFLIDKNSNNLKILELK